MSIVKTVIIKAIAEGRVEWIPKGWGWSSRKTAIIRDGKIDQFPEIDSFFIEADPNGCVEFIRAIKRTMAETVK